MRRQPLTGSSQARDRQTDQPTDLADTDNRLHHAAAAAAPALDRLAAAHLGHHPIRHIAHPADTPNPALHPSRNAAGRGLDPRRRRRAVHQLQDPRHDVPRRAVLGRSGAAAAAVGRPGLAGAVGV